MNKNDDCKTQFIKVFGDCQKGWLTIWCKKDSYKHTEWFPISSSNDAFDYALRMSERGQDAYFGLGIREIRLDSSRRGKYDDIIAITCLWADIDVQATAHKETQLPQSQEEAVAWINTLKLKPTMLVKSANGLHVYWLFETPWYFTDATDRDRAQALSDGFQAAIRAEGAEKGWQFDNTADYRGYS